MYFSGIYKVTSKGIFLWVSTISCKGEWQNCFSIQFWSRACVYRLNFRQKKQNRRQISIIWAREGSTSWSLQTWSYMGSLSEAQSDKLVFVDRRNVYSNTKKYVYMTIMPISHLLSPQKNKVHVPACVLDPRYHFSLHFQHGNSASSAALPRPTFSKIIHNAK